MKEVSYLDFLMINGKLNKNNVNQIMSYRKKNKPIAFEEVLLELKIFKEYELANKLINYLNMSVIYNLEPFINMELFKKYNLEVFKKYSVFPVIFSNDTLYVATMSPLYQERLNNLEKEFQIKVSPIISTKSEIIKVLSLVNKVINSNSM